MCGRFTIVKSAEELEKQFEIEIDREVYEVSYNIAPSQNALVITNEEPNIGSFFKWGLVPFWAKDIRIGYKMINARAETVFDKPAFKQAIQKRRCIIPVSGFYEWKRKGKNKIPYYITSKRKEIFAFGGLWETWNKEGETIQSFTILTTKANKTISTLHERMPVMFTQKTDWQNWLAANPTENQIKPFFDPYPAKDIQMHEVNPKVNAAKNNSPDLIKPFEQFGTLF